MKKKVALLIINNGFGEVDWILPVLYKLSKNYTIFTYFRSQSAFSSLKMVNEIFYLWKQISKGYYVEKKFDNFFWKSLRKVINPIYKKNVKINGFINKKIHDISFIEKKIFNILGLKNFEISIFFSEFGVYSGWVETIKNNFKRPLIVHFPSHSSIYSKKKIKKNQLRKVKMLSGDLLLLSTEREILRFSNFININKIIVSGVPKFDNWWINKVLNSKFDFDVKNFRNKSVISMGIRPKFHLLEGKDFKRLENQIHDVMKVLCRIKNVLIIIKVHPKINSPHFFKILENYDNKKWITSKNHLTKLSKISNCTINSINSAVPLDALCVNKPSIELWQVKKNENQTNEQKKEGISVQAKNKKNFASLIKLVLKKPNHQIWMRQKKSFMNIYKFKNLSTLKVINILNNSLKNLKNSM